jgi:ubiquinone/menaquinone biosynthesis C-methylase UbiE
VQSLSFPDNYFDVILSNDVFEHISEPQREFQESARVLKKGGLLIFTIPFHRTYNNSLARAILEKNGSLTHLLPEQYHGNPLSEKGSLVFTDFGWDVLDNIKNTGFSEAHVNIYYSKNYAHLGQYQIVFLVVGSVHFNFAC